MLEQLTKEVKSQLYDRAKSPLFGGFALAWIAWNFRAMVVLFSDLTYREKVTEWNVIYPGPEAWFNQALLWPSMSAILFIVAYPLPARWVFQYWYSQHKEMKKVQQQIEDDTPLTQAEALALRRTAIQDQSAMHKQMAELTARIKEASNQNEALLERIAIVEGERDRAISHANELEKTLVDVTNRQGVLSTAAIDGMFEPADWVPGALVPLGGAETLLSAVSQESLARVMKTLGLHSKDRTTLAVFLAIVAGGGDDIGVAKLAASIGANRIEVEHAFDKLAHAEVITLSNPGKYRLTSSGRTLAVSTGLTAVLKPIDLSESGRM